MDGMQNLDDEPAPTPAGDARPDRRSVLAAGMTALVGGAAPAPAAPPEDTASRVGRPLRAGLIGCGWYGMVDLRHVMQSGQAQVTAVCDPDRRHLQAAVEEISAAQGTAPRAFVDYRRMLAARDLDIVLVASPDHWHALHMIAAVQAGADVYVQKPISHTFAEGQAMVAAARKYRRVVQVGTQRRSTPHILAAREWVREGKLGRIGQVHAWCHVRMRGADGPPDEPPPDYLDWDLWTGPAPLRPYNPAIHPKRWRRFTEYSNGILGDMGVHWLDLMRWFMDVRYPRHVASHGGILVERTGNANVTDTQQVVYDYGEFQVTWEHRTWGAPDDPSCPWGVRFAGERGSLRIDLNGAWFTPVDRGGRAEEILAEREHDASKLEGDHIRPAGRAHMLDFLRCVRTRERPVADIEEGHVSTALCQLGNIAQRLGRGLRWDGARETVIGDPAATRLLTRPYRAPWRYPGTMLP